MMLEMPFQMPIADLMERGEFLARTGQRVSVLWQKPESLAFVARGREYRSEFHINPSDELMYMIKGEMNLHFRQPDGSEDIAVVKQGSVIYTPSGVPHSPRFPPDAFLMVVERQRRAGEIDRFHWYCPACDQLLHEESFSVEDYAADPVSLAYKRFFDSETFRTCTACGNVMPSPGAT
jgi:3-hydroxyanthranilate 3,4-dioxygenase